MEPPCSLCLLHVAAAASGAEGNGIGAEGAKALADALAPRQNPDGTWTHNNALSYLILFSAPSRRPTPLPLTSSSPRPSIPSLLLLLFVCSAVLCCFLRHQVQT